MRPSVRLLFSVVVLAALTGASWPRPMLPHSFLPIGFQLEKFTLAEMPLIGTHNGLRIREGGVSGLVYRKGKFYLLSDRGPNADGGKASAAKGGNPMLFPFPKYAPKVWTATLDKGELKIMGKNVIRRPDFTAATGLPLPTQSAEQAWADTLGTLLPHDAWGMDAEGLALAPNGDWWVCEEYGASIWHLDANFKVIHRYTPNPTQPQDLPLDAAYGKRRPNRGFEGIACTPNGLVYALLQSPADIPNAKAGQESRLHRLLEINPATGRTRTFVYEHDAPIGNIRNQDWKIGDLAAINNTDFLVLEHAERKGTSVKNVYKISLSGATPLTEKHPQAAALEPLGNSAALLEAGIRSVRKALVADLLQLGWEAIHDKPEGLAVVNDSTFAVINDNDFGIDAPRADGQLVATGKTTRLYLFTLPRGEKLSKK